MVVFLVVSEKIKSKKPSIYAWYSTRCERRPPASFKFTRLQTGPKSPRKWAFSLGGMPLLGPEETFGIKSAEGASLGAPMDEIPHRTGDAPKWPLPIPPAITRNAPRTKSACAWATAEGCTLRWCPRAASSGAGSTATAVRKNGSHWAAILVYNCPGHRGSMCKPLMAKVRDAQAHAPTSLFKVEHASCLDKRAFTPTEGALD